MDSKNFEDVIISEKHYNKNDISCEQIFNFSKSNEILNGVTVGDIQSIDENDLDN